MNRKNLENMHNKSTFNPHYFSETKMKKSVHIYNEVMEEANNNEERINYTNYFIKEINSIIDHLKEVAGQLNEVKRYWIEKGDCDNETNRKEVATAILRLTEIFEGMKEYLTEMGRWWNEKRNTPPLLTNLYNGPDNSVFLSSILGYTETTNKKQFQTRTSLIELELITQFLDIAAGKNYLNLKDINTLNRGYSKPKIKNHQIIKIKPGDSNTKANTKLETNINKVKKIIKSKKDIKICLSSQTKKFSLYFRRHQRGETSRTDHGSFTTCHQNSKH